MDFKDPRELSRPELISYVGKLHLFLQGVLESSHDGNADLNYVIHAETEARTK